MAYADALITGGIYWAHASNKARVGGHVIMANPFPSVERKIALQRDVVAAITQCLCAATKQMSRERYRIAWSGSSARWIDPNKNSR